MSNTKFVACFVGHLQLLLLEHAGFGCVQDVVGQLSLAVDVDRCRGFAGQEAVVDLSGTLGKLMKKSKIEKKKDE